MAKKKPTDHFAVACKQLGISDILPDVSAFQEKDQKSIIAYHKLIIIARAWNEGWEPNWRDRSQYKYFPWFYVDSAGLACADANYAVADANAYFGSRLGFRTEALANRAKVELRDLYMDFLFIPGEDVR